MNIFKLTIDYEIKSDKGNGSIIEKSVELDVDFLFHILNELPFVEESKPIGCGTEFSPFILRGIRQWAYAASRSTTEYCDIYIIANHILQRNPLRSEGYTDYITDIVDAGIAIGFAKNQLDDFGRVRYFKKTEDKTISVYGMKYNRIKDERQGFTDSGIVSIMRNILDNEMIITSVLSELPGLMAAMFLSEVKRQPKMLILGLMMLDLIERNAYVAGLHFTLETCLFYKSASDKEGALHPMFHSGSVGESKEINFNNVWIKSSNILVAWLFFILIEVPWIKNIKVSVSKRTTCQGYLRKSNHEAGIKKEIKAEIMNKIKIRAIHANAM